MSEIEISQNQAGAPEDRLAERLAGTVFVVIQSVVEREIAKNAEKDMSHIVHSARASQNK